MSLPALGAVRERFPNARIAVLARPWVAGLYRHEPFADEIILYEPARSAAGPYYGPVATASRWPTPCAHAASTVRCCFKMPSMRH